jgi:hypothetical protein
MARPEGFEPPTPQIRRSMQGRIIGISKETMPNFPCFKNFSFLLVPLAQSGHKPVTKLSSNSDFTSRLVD